MMKVIFTLFLCLTFVSPIYASESASELNRAKALFNDRLYDDSFEKFKNLSELNNPEAQYYLGEIYKNGLGNTEENIEIAASWYEKSALAGFPKSQTELGLLYLYDIGNQSIADNQKGVSWLEKASQNGDKTATGWLGYFYFSGELNNSGFKQDFERALPLLKEASRGGDKDSYVLYAITSYMIESKKPNFDLQEVKKWIDKAFINAAWWSDDEQIKKFSSFLADETQAKKGDPVKQLQVANLYNQNLFLELELNENDTIKVNFFKKDISKALYWSQEALQGGNADAEELMGELILFELMAGSDKKNLENLADSMRGECGMNFECAFAKIWQYLDVSGDNAISTAELSKFQRALANSVYIENFEALEIEELSALNLGLVIILPFTSTAIVSNFDYNNDGVLQKNEVFTDTEFAKLIGIDPQSLTSGVNFSEFAKRLNSQLQSLPLQLFN